MDPSTPLRGLRLAVIDCESTSLPPGAHIVEIAVVHVTIDANETPRVAYTTKVRPPVPIPGDATRIHGITDADVADAPTWAEVVPHVIAAIGDRVPCAFNVPADWQFTTDEQERIGCGPLSSWREWVDLHVIARDASKYEHSLSQVMIAHGVALDAHGATGDAVATALVAAPLLSAWWRRMIAAPRYDYPEDDTDYESDDEDDQSALPPATLGTLLDWQHRAALEHEQDFVAFLRKKGARGRRPDSPWHALLGVPEPAWPEPPKPTYRVEKDGTVVRVEVSP